jgi:hypothetical protein
MPFSSIIKIIISKSGLLLLLLLLLILLHAIYSIITNKKVFIYFSIIFIKRMKHATFGIKRHLTLKYKNKLNNSK